MYFKDMRKICRQHRVKPDMVYQFFLGTLEGKKKYEIADDIECNKNTISLLANKLDDMDNDTKRQLIFQFCQLYVVRYNIQEKLREEGFQEAEE